MFQSFFKVRKHEELRVTLGTQVFLSPRRYFASSRASSLINVPNLCLLPDA